MYGSDVTAKMATLVVLEMMVRFVILGALELTVEK